MKTFETTADILRNARDFHLHVEKFCQELREQSSNDRSKMLLDYMLRDASKSIAELENFIQHTSKPALKSWVQITLEHSPKDFFEGLPTHDDMSFEEIGTLGQQIDQYLVEVFNALGDIVVTDELHVIFANLAEIETNRKRRLSQAINSLMREM